MSEKPTFQEFEPCDQADEAQLTTAQATDVTESESRTLDEIMENLRSLYQEAPLAYFIVGLDGTIEGCNKIAEQLSEYRTEELYGKHIKELFREPSENRRKIETILDNLLQGDVIHNEQVQIVKKDGSVICGSLTPMVIKSSDGKIIKSLLMIR